LLEQAIQTLTQHVAALTEAVSTLDQSIKAANTISAKPKAPRKSTSKASASKAKAEEATPSDQVQIDTQGTGVTMQPPQAQPPQAPSFTPGQGYSPGAPVVPQAPEQQQYAPPAQQQYAPPAQQQYAPPAQPLPPPANQVPVEITAEILREELVGLYTETRDNRITAEILAPFGANTVVDLKPEQYAEVYYAVRERRSKLPRRG
jgi:hypothetical protein